MNAILFACDWNDETPGNGTYSILVDPEPTSPSFKVAHLMWTIMGTASIYDMRIIFDGDPAGNTSECFYGEEGADIYTGWLSTEIGGIRGQFPEFEVPILTTWTDSVEVFEFDNVPPDSDIQSRDALHASVKAGNGKKLQSGITSMCLSERYEGYNTYKHITDGAYDIFFDTRIGSESGSDQPMIADDRGGGNFYIRKPTTIAIVVKLSARAKSIMHNTYKIFNTADYTDEDLADMGMTREELAAVMSV